MALPEGWSIEKLDNVLSIFNGGTPKTDTPEYWNGKHNWLTPAEMGKLDSPYILNTNRKITSAGINNSSAKLIPPNSVILSTRAPIGYVVINSVEMSFNQGCKGLVPRSDKISAKYLYYFLAGNVDLLNKLGSGTTFKELSTGKLKEVKVPVPSLKEQKRIVAILDEAFAGISQAIANTEKNLANVRELFERYLSEVFTRKGEGWSNITFDQIADFKNGLNYTQNSKGDFIKIVGVKDFKNKFQVDTDELDTVQIDGSLSKLYKLQENDILLVRSNGNKQLIGRSLLIGAIDGEVSYSGFTIRARLKTKDVEPTYLVHYLKSQAVRDALVNAGNGANISSLNQTALSCLIIHYPLKSIQRKIVENIEIYQAMVTRLVEVYQCKLAALAELKQSLLQKAFSGELTAHNVDKGVNL